MIHVLIVEDDPMARQLLEIYVEKSGAYTLAQSVESAAFAELPGQTDRSDSHGCLHGHERQRTGSGGEDQTGFSLY